MAAFEVQGQGTTGSVGPAPKYNARQSTRDVLALEVADRQNLLDDYQEGVYQPRVPTSPQMRVRSIVVSLPWLIVQVLAMFVDIFFVFAEWSTDPTPLNLATVRITSSIYVTDIVLRIFAMGARDFFLSLVNIFDFLVVLITAYYAFAVGQGGGSALRSLRFIRVIYMIFNTNAKRTAARQVTGENKKRFVDTENDLDIDLAYVTDRCIAMSVPAEGMFTRMYRNDINDVVRFFGLFHAGHFHIVNACPELPYKHNAFGRNQRAQIMNVDNFNVQDHTPPLIDQYIRFFEICRTWMSEHEENILAVHCRGGKGRTGSFVCGWLLYHGDAQNDGDALNIFAIARTDLEKDGAHKLQGVETPSQVRYVGYISQLLLGGPDGRILHPSPVAAPPVVTLKLEKLTLNNMLASPKGQLMVAVHVPRKDSQEKESAWQIIAWSKQVFAEESVSFTLQDVEVSGDVRISVFDSDQWKKVEALDKAKKHVLAGKEPGCEFFFLFHTSFHAEDIMLEIPTTEIDKAFKSPKYKREGSAELHFTRNEGA